MNKYNRLAPFFLRLIIGFGFIEHGWAKISGGTGGFEKLLIQINIPFPHFNAILVPTIEILGGFTVLIGAFVVITAVPLIITMLVAMFTIHLHYGFSSINTTGLTPEGPTFGPPGYEINLLYIAGLISLMLTGGGGFSIDSLIKKQKGSNSLLN